MHTNQYQKFRLFIHSLYSFQSNIRVLNSIVAKRNAITDASLLIELPWINDFSEFNLSCLFATEQLSVAWETAHAELDVFLICICPNATLI